MSKEVIIEDLFECLLVKRLNFNRLETLYIGLVPFIIYTVNNLVIKWFGH